MNPRPQPVRRRPSSTVPGAVGRPWAAPKADRPVGNPRGCEKMCLSDASKNVAPERWINRKTHLLGYDLRNRASAQCSAEHSIGCPG